MAISIEALPAEIIYGAEGVAEVVQNVRTILTTRKGTVPLDRAFGLSFEFLDDPEPAAIAAIQGEIFQQIRKYEPRAQIKEIRFNNDPLSGRLCPTVKIEVVL